MKASELRIGNLVDSPDGITPIIEIDGYNNHVVVHDEKYNDRSGYLISSIKPIPLTEEWLLKFGFVQINEFQDHYRWVIDMNDKFGVLFEWNKNTFNYGWIKNPTDVKYVHQLQNLYFALTGEELTLK